jgi:hypothetical protein
MLLAGALAISGPAILTFSIWISMLGLIGVGVFLVARAKRPCAGGGAVVAAIAVWIAYFWRTNPGPFLWPVGVPGGGRVDRVRHALGRDQLKCLVVASTAGRRGLGLSG